MAIMEKNLPIAESLGEGDKLRIVTSEGNSKQIDAGQIGGSGGGTLVANLYQSGETEVSLDKTWQQIHDAYVGGSMILIRNYYEDESTHEVTDYLYNVYFVGCDIIPGGQTTYRVVSHFSNDESLICNSPDGYPSATFD